MPLLPSIVKSFTSDPDTHRGMYEVMLDYMVPDYRPLYNTVVREINWVAGTMAIAMFEEKFEDDFDYTQIKESACDEFETVLRQINHRVSTNRRFYVWAKRFKEY